jgi:hypothetical protein
MAVRECNDQAVGREGLKPMKWVREEACFGLLAACDHRRPRLLKATEFIPESPRTELIQSILSKSPSSELLDCFDQELSGILPMGSVGIDIIMEPSQCWLETKAK